MRKIMKAMWAMYEDCVWTAGIVVELSDDTDIEESPRKLFRDAIFV